MDQGGLVPLPEISDANFPFPWIKGKDVAVKCTKDGCRYFYARTKRPYYWHAALLLTNQSYLVEREEPFTKPELGEFRRRIDDNLRRVKQLVGDHMRKHPGMTAPDAYEDVYGVIYDIVTAKNSTSNESIRQLLDQYSAAIKTSAQLQAREKRSFQDSSSVPLAEHNEKMARFAEQSPTSEQAYEEMVSVMQTPGTSPTTEEQMPEQSPVDDGKEEEIPPQVQQEENEQLNVAELLLPPEEEQPISSVEYAEQTDDIAALEKEDQQHLNEAEQESVQQAHDALSQLLGNIVVPETPVLSNTKNYETVVEDAPVAQSLADAKSKRRPSDEEDAEPAVSDPLQSIEESIRREGKPAKGKKVKFAHEEPPIATGPIFTIGKTTEEEPSLIQRSLQELDKQEKEEAGMNDDRPPSTQELEFQRQYEESLRELAAIQAAKYTNNNNN